MEAALEPPRSFVRDLRLSERTALRAQGEVESALRAALAPGASDGIPDAFVSAFRARFPAPGVGEALADEPFSIERYGRAGGGPALDAESFLERLRAHVLGWTELARATFETDRFFLAPTLARATGRAELHLAGELAGGARESLRATCAVELVLEGERWKLGALELLEGTRIRSRDPLFADVSRACGFDEGLSRENRALFQSFVDQHVTLAHGGLSALDWNDDGFPDLLATRAGQVATLFLNDGAGGFLPAELPLRSSAQIPSFFLWLDLDDDGLEELVGASAIDHAGERARLGLWTRRAGSWELVPDALVLPIRRGERRLAVQTIVPCDVNGDERLDLFVGVYGNERSRGSEFNTIDAHDGADNHLFVNQGGLRFSEESEARGIRGTRYTYVGFAFDFDADGDEDLWEGNDFGPNSMWENDGTGNFREQEDSDFAGHPSYTMGVTLADWDDEGVWSLYVANMSAEAGSRILAIADGLDETTRAKIGEIASGNALYRQTSDGKRWPRVPGAAGAWEGEWAWGSVFFDVDGDGDEELYVTNGFTSHSRRELGDWDGHYWRQVIADGHAEMRGEASRDANADAPFEGSFSGYQRDRLFYNPDGGSELVEAAWHFGLDLEDDGRSVVPVDVDGDGDLDLALWTLQGLRLLLRRGHPASFARVRLEATRSQHHALGAVVTLHAGGRTQRERVRCVEGFQSQLPLEIHCGLGEAETIDTLRIEWPSGAVEEHRDLPSRALLVLREGDAPRVETLARWPLEASPPTDEECRAELERLPPGPLQGPQVIRRDAATWIVDAEGRLVRAFRRAASDAEIRSVLELAADEPTFAELLAESGRRELRAGRLRPAIEQLTRALAQRPDLAWAWAERGRAHAELGRPDLAEADYVRATEADPDYALGWYNLGVTRSLSRRPLEALAPLREAVAIEGERPQMLLALGEAAALAGESELALDAFHRAALADPGSPEGLVLEAKVLAQLERYAEAHERLREALARAPEHAEALRVLRAVEAHLPAR